MVLLRFLVYYAIPLVIIGVFYVLIARHLMYAANVPGEMQGAVRQVNIYNGFRVLLVWLMEAQYLSTSCITCQAIYRVDGWAGEWVLLIILSMPTSNLISLCSIRFLN